MLAGIVQECLLADFLAINDVDFAQDLAHRLAGGYTYLAANVRIRASDLPRLLAVHDKVGPGLLEHEDSEALLAQLCAASLHTGKERTVAKAARQNIYSACA